MCVCRTLHQTRVPTIKPGNQTAILEMISVLGEGAQNPRYTPNLEKVSTKGFGLWSPKKE